ncbi:endonuclease/exonuclease/phosphatase family protein [Conyzicola sp.]|uniref:endonuclease/exonuclease/phosphatase family protein n=1 Tax=Conyzicola sp. TaxID=1969404 RepID=UPI00398A0F41
MFRRVLAAAVIVVVAAALFVLAWPQFFGLQQAFGVAHVVSLRAAAALIALALIVVLTLLALLARPARRFFATLAVLLVVFALVNTAVLSTRGFGDTAFETAGDSTLTVLAWNTLGDVPGAATVAELALENDVDILALPETTKAFSLEVAALMKAAGRPMWVETTAFDQISKSRSTSVLWTADLGTYTVDTEVGQTATLPTVVLRPDDGSGPTIIGVHAVAPIPGEFRNWQADLDWLADTCSGENVIMAGDFNATLDHMSGLASSGSTTLGDCADAALATGNGAVGTWPTTAPALLGAPIDHAMATENWRVTGMRVVQDQDGAGSDHRPLIAQFAPAG